MQESLQLASIKEAAGNESAEQMVQAIVYDFDQLLKELKDGMNVAEQQSDGTTGDMLLAIYSSLEKHAWMLRSFLGK